MVEGRGVQAMGVFAEALRLHGGQPSQVEAIAMDMSTSYMKGASQYFPQARIGSAPEAETESRTKLKQFVFEKRV